MTRILSTLFALALIAGVLPAAAQETTEAPAEAEASEAPATEAEPAEAETAEPADAEAPVTPQPGDITITEHGDWEVRCESDVNCLMYQLLRDEQLNPVAEITLLPLPAGGDAVAGVTIVTPLGTLLTEGIQWRVDSGRVVPRAFGWCTGVGCFSRFGVSNEELAGLKRGNVTKLRIVSVSNPEQPVVLDVSLTGFTAAWDDVSGR